MIRNSIVASALFIGLAAPALAQETILDQISDYADIYTSQDFEASNDAFDIATIDDFTVSDSANLTLIEAGIGGFNLFAGFGNITGYNVEVYSSRAAAAGDLSGDIASFSFAPGDVTLDTGFFTSPDTALVTIPVDIDLDAAGTYFISVIMNLDFGAGGGQIGILAGGTGNAFQANPNGGFGFPGGTQDILGPLGNPLQAAYRIEGIVGGTQPPVIPEPTTWAMMISGFGLVGGAMRRRRVTVSYASA